MDSIKDVVRSSVKVPEFDKHLKEAGVHIGRGNCGNNNKDEDNSLKTLKDKNIHMKICNIQSNFFAFCGRKRSQFKSAWIFLLLRVNIT